MKLFREYSLTLVSFTATLVLTLVAGFVLRLSDKDTYVAFAAGVVVTLAATLLEKELKETISRLEIKIRNEISHTLRLYELLERIDDRDLQDQVLELADDLGKGQIPPHIAALRSRELLEQVKESLQTTDCPYIPQTVYEWQDNPRLRSWFEGNLQALKRGVTIERVFVLKRSEVIRNGAWDERTLSILQEQSKAGIQVRVLWTEDLAIRPPRRNLYQDFVIYDGQEILVIEGKFLTRMYRTPSDKVREYKEIFAEQKKFSTALEEVIGQVA